MVSKVWIRYAAGHYRKGQYSIKLVGGVLWELRRYNDYIGRFPRLAVAKDAADKDADNTITSA